MRYEVTIKDIADIQNQKILEIVCINAESKADAMDKSHDIAFKLYPKNKRFVEIKNI